MTVITVDININMALVSACVLVTDIEPTTVIDCLGGEEQVCIIRSVSVRDITIRIIIIFCIGTKKLFLLTDTLQL